jgi:hypothetical protein
LAIFHVSPSATIDHRPLSFSARTNNGRTAPARRAVGRAARPRGVQTRANRLSRGSTSDDTPYSGGRRMRSHRLFCCGRDPCSGAARSRSRRKRDEQALRRPAAEAPCAQPRCGGRTSSSPLVRPSRPSQAALPDPEHTVHDDS